jgi:DNA polymerase III delta prime subunit
MNFENNPEFEKFVKDEELQQQTTPEEDDANPLESQALLKDLIVRRRDLVWKMLMELRDSGDKGRAQAEVLMHRFGFNAEGKEYTLEEIADRMDRNNRQRIQQINTEALLSFARMVRDRGLTKEDWLD